jgi:RHS repeat-associated protein
VLTIERDVGNSTVRKQLYIGGLLEQEELATAPGGGSYSDWTTWAQWTWNAVKTRLYIPGPGGVIGVYNYQMDAATTAGQKRHWFHYDHLGSIVAVTNDAAGYGEKVAAMSYDPWGVRRDPATWDGIVSGHPAPLPNAAAEFTDRGFTGHEMLDHLGLVHMNGRIYDPHISRFLSPDPFIQFPGFFDSYNRYSYVLNNPLKYTDPSGYTSTVPKERGAWDFFKSMWRPILAIIVAVVLHQYWIVEKGFGFWAYVGIGAISGGIAGGLQGAAYGALAAALFYGVGQFWNAQYGKEAQALMKFDDPLIETARALSHGVTGGALAAAQGGKFQHGFLPATFSSMTNSFLSVKFPAIDIENRILVAATIGGTASALGGGKFMNGAMTATFETICNAVAAGAARKGYGGRYTAEDEAMLHHKTSAHVIAVPEGSDVWGESDAEHTAYYENRVASTNEVISQAGSPSRVEFIRYKNGVDLANRLEGFKVLSLMIQVHGGDNGIIVHYNGRYGAVYLYEGAALYYWMYDHNLIQYKPTWSYCTPRTTVIFKEELNRRLKHIRKIEGL